ncbi:pentatricopeptide repeat-containing protein At5g56310-like [Magnolia sinica]|uniref:pentatricopeptide repeat-containing protein At5g56310-like n=1 Tax=Magnolia sinica TaxID=86752 RepID=UPI00265B4FC4|nr:pentatricopeptide repeat-containing protein At5g56310-like [Magnolia sinica]
MIKMNSRSGELMPASSEQQGFTHAASSGTSLLLISLSQSCTSMRQLKRIHARLIRNNLNLNNLILAKMLRFTAVSPSGDLHYARLLFHHMLQTHQRNTFFYNTIIRGHAKSHTPSQSITFFKEMRRNSVAPDEFTFTFLLKAAASPQMMPFCGEEIHAQVLKFGYPSHTFVQNTLIHLYAAKGAPDASCQVFDETPTPDVVSWSGLVVAHVKARQLDKARHLFEDMPEKDVVSWTAMLSGYAQAGRPRQALELFQEMQAEGVSPDEVTMVGLISACTSLGDLEAGLRMHSYVEESGFGWMVSLCNALIDMYSKCGCLEKARGVFEKMERKSLITWNSMITACAIHGTVEEAIGLFERMEEAGSRPDSVTFLAVISACAHKGWVKEGHRLFESMRRDYGIEAGIEHYGCMVDMLGRAGELEEAYCLIMEMPIQSNDAVWGALLGACRIHGDVDMGERVIKKLLQLKPDEGGYYILLCNIYLAAGQQVEAIKMRRMMKERGAKKTPGCSRLG